MGSYASLSVCSLSGLDQKLLDNNSYLKKYYVYEFKTSPQYRGFIGAFSKKINYTLKRILPVNMGFVFKIRLIQATAVPLMETMGTKYLLIFRLTSDYTLKTKNRFYVHRRRKIGKIGGVCDTSAWPLTGTNK